MRLINSINSQFGEGIAQNDGECHMSTSGDYTHSTILDSPSISQIDSKVKENAINVIFAVTPQQNSAYSEFSNQIEGSKITALSEDPWNVVELVKDQYKVRKILFYFQTGLNFFFIIFYRVFNLLLK